MAVLYVPHFVQFFNSNGDPLSGGKLYTYSAGTTTPKATYTNEGGATPNANPVVLDSAGRAVVFLTGSYKFRLEDSLGNLIRETDNVTAFSTQASTVDNIVANFTETVVATGDSFIFADASDSNATRRDTIQGILDLVPATNVSAISSTVATTSGTTQDISLNANIKQFTVNLSSVSFNASAQPTLLLGTSGSFETSGYAAICSFVSTAVGTASSSSAIIMTTTSSAATVAYQGSIVFTLLDASTNEWAFSGSLGDGTIPATFIVSGSKALSGALTRIRLGSVGGATFDAGKFNVVSMY
jgi:hypothetical protein